ncbi:MAG: hypothetical protein GY926_05795 [bacterium]|nr:hypothetical protein [bacterium]
MTQEPDWLAIAGVTGSFAGIGVAVWLYKRAGRRHLQTGDDLTEIEFGAGAEAAWRSLVTRFNISAKHHRSFHGPQPDPTEPEDGTTGITELQDSSDEPTEVVELPCAESEPLEFRRTYTEHEVAAYYEAMSDEDLGIDRTDRDISPPDPGTMNDAA